MEDRDLTDAIKTRASYHRTPDSLRARILKVLRGRDAGRESAPAGSAAVRPWGWVSLAAAFAFGLVLASGVAMWGWLPPGIAPGADLTGQLVASHVRSLMAAHLTDVASSDQHTVKPWFNGKVDFSPQVIELAAQGFPLIGGRLDYLERRPVAALVYKRRAHPINLFIWPDGRAEQAVRASAEQGYHVRQWRHAGMRYAAVSDLNDDELRDFVQEYRRQSAAQ